MRNCVRVCAFWLFALALSFAQTQVTTTGGTTNTVPKFTGSSSIGNSAISEVGGNLGIGTTSPRGPLDVQNPNPSLFLGSSGNSGTSQLIMDHAGGSSNQQKVAIMSDAIGGWGRGNLRFAVNTLNDLSNVSLSDTKMYIDGTTGNVGIRTTSPVQALDVIGDVRLSGGGWGFRLNPVAGELRLRNDQDTAYLPFHVGRLVADGGITFPDGSTQTTAAVGGAGGGTITGVTAGSGLTGGGTAGNVTLSVDSTVARLNAAQTFNGNITINGTLRATSIVTSQVLAGHCDTVSFVGTAFVLNGLGQSTRTSCDYGPGSPTLSPIIGTAVERAGTISNLIVKQASLNSSALGGTVQVWINQKNNTTPLQTSISCVLPTGGTVGICTGVGSQSLSAGDRVVVVVTPPSGSSVGPVSATLDFN